MFGEYEQGTQEFLEVIDYNLGFFLASCERRVLYGLDFCLVGWVFWLLSEFHEHSDEKCRMWPIFELNKTSIKLHKGPALRQDFLQQEGQFSEDQ